jgi:hypothetical protein
MLSNTFKKLNRDVAKAKWHIVALHSGSISKEVSVLEVFSSDVKFIIYRPLTEYV